MSKNRTRKAAALKNEEMLTSRLMTALLYTLFYGFFLFTASIVFPNALLKFAVYLSEIFGLVAFVLVLCALKRDGRSTRVHSLLFLFACALALSLSMLLLSFMGKEGYWHAFFVPLGFVSFTSFPLCIRRGCEFWVKLRWSILRFCICFVFPFFQGFCFIGCCLLRLFCSGERRLRRLYTPCCVPRVHSAFTAKYACLNSSLRLPFLSLLFRCLFLPPLCLDIGQRFRSSSIFRIWFSLRFALENCLKFVIMHNTGKKNLYKILENASVIVYNRQKLGTFQEGGCKSCV